MTRLQRLYDEQGQSPWLDDLNRGYLRDGTLALMTREGIRGVTANPTILANAFERSNAYDTQLAKLVSRGRSVSAAYWDTLPEPTITAFEDHGTLARTIDAEVDDAERVMHELDAVGVDLEDIGRTLEDRGIAAFHEASARALAVLDNKAATLVSH